MQTIRVGVLHSLSGVMARSEQPLLAATTLALDELNAAGGLLGRRVEAAIVDGRSDPAQFASAARRLLGQGVTTLFGCWTSSARKAVKAVVEERDGLLFYPVQYEGLEESPNIIYTGSTLNQQIPPALEWAVAQGWRSALLVGSDYVYPRTANLLTRSLLRRAQVELRDELYVPLDGDSFAEVVAAIVNQRPAFVLNTINGEGNRYFFEQLAAAGVTAGQVPVISFSLPESELARLPATVGHYAAWGYLQSDRGEANQSFLTALRARLGDHQVVSDPMAAAYTQVRLWAAAVTRAQSFETAAVAAAARGLALDSPLGALVVCANGHVTRTARIGRVSADGTLAEVWSSPAPLPPLPWLGAEELAGPTGDVLREALVIYGRGVEQELSLSAQVRQRTRELADRERKFRAVFDQSPELLWLVDSGGLLLDASRQALLLAEAPLERLARRPVTDGPWFAGSAEVQATLTDALARAVGGEVVQFEAECCLAGDRERVVELTCGPVRDETGAVCSVLVVGHDYTERRRAEAKLRQLSRAVESSMLTVVITDAQGRIEYANPAFTEITGYSLEEALGQNPRLLNARLQPPEVYEQLWATIGRGDQWRGEFCNRRRDGTLYWESARISPIFGPDGAITHFVAVKEDITAVRQLDEERRAATEALLASEQRSRLLLEAAPDAMVIVDEQAVIQQVNAQAEDLCGRPRAELTGQPLETLLPELTPERRAALGLDGAGDAGGCRGELLVRNRLGEEVPVELRVSPLVTATGRLLVASLRDITAFRQLQAELIAARDAAEAASLAKSVFLASMSHEIRTPLNAVLGFSQLLERDGGLSPKQREYVQTINRSGEFLLSLINDILEMAKIEAGRAEVEAANFDLPRLLGEVLTLFEVRASNRGLRLELHLEPKLPQWVCTDERKLRQILINLLGNALKFTEHGAVTLRASLHRSAEGGLRLRCAVTDTGRGIPVDQQASVFERFQQVKRTAGGGTGLGLAISREFARLLGGDLTLVSHEGRGSTFTLDLPLADAVGADAEPRCAPTCEPAPRVTGLVTRGAAPKVLVVDDVDDNRRLLLELLGPLGFELREARDGEEALAVWRAWSPEVVLMDICMPVMDGDVATRQLRAEEPPGTRTVVLAVTASVFSEEEQRLLAHGADQVIGKPVVYRELLDALAAQLGVEYVYAAEADGVDAAAAAPPVSASGLPRELLEALRAAADAGRLRLLDELVAQAAEVDAAVGALLGELVSTFDYDGLDALLVAGLNHADALPVT